MQKLAKTLLNYAADLRRSNVIVACAQLEAAKQNLTDAKKYLDLTRSWGQSHLQEVYAEAMEKISSKEQFCKSLQGPLLPGAKKVINANLHPLWPNWKASFRQEVIPTK